MLTAIDNRHPRKYIIDILNRAKIRYLPVREIEEVLRALYLIVIIIIVGRRERPLITIQIEC